MECSDGEGESGGFDTAANDDLGFFFQALLRLVGRREFGRQNLLENGFLGVVGLELFTAERAGDERGLVLDALLARVIN